MCKENQETITHLFIPCPYARKVAQIIKYELKIRANWDEGSIEECFRSWIQEITSLYAGLPGIMISNIWWERNNVIFKDKFVPT
jgi:hypothetical protein